MRELPLVTGETALVSAEDYERLSEHRWMLTSPRSGPVRRARSGAGKYFVVWMHREILGLPIKAEGDDGRRGKFLNGDHLDCRRENLIIASPSSDLQNRPSVKTNPDSPTGSRYVGVRKNPNGNRWSSVIGNGGKKRYLGTFETEEQAAHAYDEAARRLHGENARVNFP